MPEPPVERVVWLDHYYHFGKYEREMGLATLASVGYLVWEDEKLIALSHTYRLDEDPSGHETLVIHKPAIIDRKRIL